MIIKKRRNIHHTLHQTSGEQVENPILQPVEYLEASVAMCVAKTLDFLDERDGLELTGYNVEVTSTSDQSLRPRRLSEVTVKIQFDDALDPALVKKLKLKAKRGCVIGHTLEHPVTVILLDDED
ncbi:hypothetical protein HMI01_23790 [Halolactibacillus miurensis]|uniref:OsmC-like protein n=1 Tax=Halolactibacillus miurensis TaxID=306541 RepID=A0A1I6UP72_9BACI|nr:MULTISPECIES: OsmC family protein [Halolactibacillus]GEM05391.1 hypothetical protein HMI01_23790 [Halolactibacillus miurensis]SFT03255.1 OsmC-like protein [Halolactibacillus miurensis]